MGEREVVIRCGATGRDVRVGITADERSFEKLKVGRATVRCEACGRQHTWSKLDARLQR